MSSSRRSYSTPRITANKLAEYMTASATTQERIIRESHESSAERAAMYGYARRAIRSFLKDMRRDIRPLAAAEKRLQSRLNNPGSTSWTIMDSNNSIEAILAAQRMHNELKQYVFVQAPNRNVTLPINGVKVSIRPDLYVHGSVRKQEHVGAAMFRMRKYDDLKTSTKRNEMGIYVAVLLKLMLNRVDNSPRVAANNLCMSIDILRGKVVLAPRTFKRHSNNLHSACSLIASHWNRVT